MLAPLRNSCEHVDAKYAADATDLEGESGQPCEEQTLVTGLRGSHTHSSARASICQQTVPGSSQQGRHVSRDPRKQLPLYPRGRILSARGEEGLQAASSDAGKRAMSEAQDWNSAGEHRKENNGHMANGGGQDLRRERSSGAPRRAQKQDRPVPRPQRSVRVSWPYVLSTLCNCLLRPRSQSIESLCKATACIAVMNGMLGPS